MCAVLAAISSGKSAGLAVEALSFAAFFACVAGFCFVFMSITPNRGAPE
jgi:hypothetical protein